MEVALQYEHVEKRYRSWRGATQIQALQDFSLTIEQGEIFGFLGPNGAGKTTAIHIAMGFVRASSGTGWILGKPFGSVPVRSRVGFLAETVAFRNSSVDSAIHFYAGLTGIPRNQIGNSVDKVLASFNLQADSKRKVGQLSRGMLQRLGLAQALVNDPELLILDEPTSALDPATRVAVRQLLLEFRNRGKTVFLSSHLLSEVELICDRVAVLSRGCVVRLGKLDELLQVGNQVEIVARGLNANMFPDASIQSPVMRLRIPVTDQRATIERIWAAGGDVISVNPVRRSLEEMFLELTRETVSSGDRVAG